jgi:hypothetical protein
MAREYYLKMSMPVYVAIIGNDGDNERIVIGDEGYLDECIELTFNIGQAELLVSWLNEAINILKEE